MSGLPQRSPKPHPAQHLAVHDNLKPVLLVRRLAADKLDQLSEVASRKVLHPVARNLRQTDRFISVLNCGWGITGKITGIHCLVLEMRRSAAAIFIPELGITWKAAA